MKLFNSARTAAPSLWGAFLLGGPVGVYYACRLASLRRRAARLSTYIHRENELHREHIRLLNHQLNKAISEEQGAAIAAAQYWRWCEKKAVVS